jgi:hypothetical protein
MRLVSTRYLHESCPGCGAGTWDADGRCASTPGAGSRGRPESAGGPSVALGDSWIHLRLCLTCGHVGCCQNSKNKHAAAHYAASAHPVIQSYEPGEHWAWCYVDRMYPVRPA